MCFFVVVLSMLDVSVSRLVQQTPPLVAICVVFVCVLSMLYAWFGLLFRRLALVSCYLYVHILCSFNVVRGVCSLIA